MRTRLHGDTWNECLGIELSCFRSWVFNRNFITRHFVELNGIKIKFIFNLSKLTEPLNYNLKLLHSLVFRIVHFCIVHFLGNILHR